MFPGIDVRDMSPMNRSQVTEQQLQGVTQLVKLDISTLYEIVGMQTLALEDPLELQSWRGMSGYSVSLDSTRLRGQHFFEERKEKLTQVICDQWRYCEKAEKYEKDFQMLMTALIPVVLSALGQPLVGLALAICAILFKYGLRDFCKCK